MRRIADPSLLLVKAAGGAFEDPELVRRGERVVAIRRIERKEEEWREASGATFWVVDEGRQKRKEEVVRVVTDGKTLKLERARPLVWKTNGHKEASVHPCDVEAVQYEWAPLEGDDLEEYLALVLASPMDAKELISWFPDVCWVGRSPSE